VSRGRPDRCLLGRPSPSGGSVWPDAASRGDPHAGAADPSHRTLRSRPPRRGHPHGRRLSARRPVRRPRPLPDGPRC